MAGKAAQCGTDSGYYRHRRHTHTEPCDPCKEAHRVAQRRYKRGSRAPEPVRCECGRKIRAAGETTCSPCRRAKGIRRRSTIHDEHDDIKRPVGWVRRGLVWHPVYEERTEVA